LLAPSAVMPFLSVTPLMRTILATATVLFAAQAFAADCVTFAEARQHIGKTQCIRGTVLHVQGGANGVTFLDFCEDYETCPFTVVVFPGDLRKLGDVGQLTGRAVEIKGTVEEYNGRAEIILRHPQQLGDGASLLPPFSKDAALAPSLPGEYDVERRGHYSAGTFKHPKKAKTKHKKQRRPTGIGDPSEP
jgi:DNA/RNA endonuclease YhcR with UshA esterase domain